MGIETIAIASLAASAIGTGISAIGSMQSAEAQAANAKYQSQVMENNAEIAKQNAQMVTAAGEQAASVQGMKTKATVGAIKAAQAASNIDVNTGSAVEVRSSASELGQLDALTIRSNAAKEAYGYNVQASNFQATSQLDTAEASQAVTAGMFGASSNILAGAGAVGNNYVKMSQSIPGGLF